MLLNVIYSLFSRLYVNVIECDLFFILQAVMLLNVIYSLFSRL